MAKASRPADLPFDLHMAPGHLLRRCHQRSHDLYKQMDGTRGLTRQQTALLIAIGQNPGASQQELSEATGVDRNTLADISNRLAEKGLIERERSETDARAWRVTLTRRGQSQVERIIPAARDVQEQILEPLPPELRPVFIRCLRILAGLEDAETRPLSHK